MRAGESRRILLVDDHAAVRHGLALVDLAHGTDDVLELVSDLCARNIPVLVSSMHEDALHVRRALAAGSRGYITRREAPSDLTTVQRSVPRIKSRCGKSSVSVRSPRTPDN